MKVSAKLSRSILLAMIGLCVALSTQLLRAETNEIRIVEIQGNVEIRQRGAERWVLTQTNQLLFPLDHLRTGPNSRLAIRWSAESVIRIAALTEIEIQPPPNADSESGLHLIRGLLSFFHRDKPGRIRIITSGALAGIEGTEFTMEVAETNRTERTILSVMDGKVRLENAGASLTVTNGEQALAEPGTAPRRTAGFIANNLLQWCFYYPAVLDLNDLQWSTAEQTDLADSLAAYRGGNLPAALATFPTNRIPVSDAERIYHAALLLSVGQVEPAQHDLAAIRSNDRQTARLASALQTLIAATKNESINASPEEISTSKLATELLAESYYEQSRAVPDKSLKAALALAKQAVTVSPEFGFGWERVAELEFCFGRTDRATEALDKALALSPHNAQAIALKGFLLAAQNKASSAIESFDRAIAEDSSLGNAWLGRGLCRIRKGDVRGGREDLLIAAALEPVRAALRSYLAKAWSETGDDLHALKELQLAKTLDPNDPTAWLYSALVNEQNNRINEAVRDLEKSRTLNTNRAVYRSQLLLDQDQAVRSANLARIYSEAGLDDVAMHEASRSIAADYGNFSAHLFLANSYEQLRRQSPFDLRYETPAFSEYLIASLLGPADGRLLAQPVTQQEYTRLFDRDSFGFSSSTEYLSRGAWSQYAAQYGTFHNSSYAVENTYLWDPGQQRNGKLEQRQTSLKFKQMLTPSDGLFFQVTDFVQSGGDIAQHYDPANAVAGFRWREKQEPSFLVGYDHRWSESQRTLFLFSHFNDSLSLTNPHGGTFLFASDGSSVFQFTRTDLAQTFENRLTSDSFELQHWARINSFQTIAGARIQLGTDRLSNRQGWQQGNANDIFFDLDPFGFTVATNQSLRAHSLRVSPYLYEYWQATKSFCVIGGISFDYQNRPRNALYGPLDGTTEVQRQLSPKVGFIWQPAPRSTVRAAYSKSLAGANLEQSVRLEPTQLAGFVQSYRSLIPDSIAGSVVGDHMETGDVSFEQKFETGTYVTLAAEWLRSKTDRSVGAFLHDFSAEGPAVQTPERLRFEERSAEISVHQLLGDLFSVSARYRISDARLATSYPQVDPAVNTANSNLRGVMQLVRLDGLFQHPCGFFADAQGCWWSQQLKDDLASTPGDHFWQLNLLTGYRSPRRHFEITIGLLNATGQDYRLHPINLHPELPRERTLIARLQLNF